MSGLLYSLYSEQDEQYYPKYSSKKKIWPAPAWRGRPLQEQSILCRYMKGQEFLSGFATPLVVEIDLSKVRAGWLPARKPRL